MLKSSFKTSKRLYCTAFISLILSLFSFKSFSQKNPIPSNEWVLLTSESNIDLQPFSSIKPPHKFIINKRTIIIYKEKDEPLSIQDNILVQTLPSELKLENNIEEYKLNNLNVNIFVQIKTSQLPINTLNDLASKFNISNLQMDWLQHNLLRGNINTSNIDQIIAHPNVLWIELASEDQRLDEEVFGLTNASLIMPHSSIEGLAGDDITVGVGDNSNIMHVDFINRVTNYNPWNYQNHGEHVTGTVAGKGNKDWYGRGYAPNADIICDYFSQIIAKASPYYNHSNMSVTNNSYGQFLGDCDFMGTYNATSQAMDEIATETPYILHVFAAANDGNYTCTPYPKGYRTVNGAFASSKNSIVVANMRKKIVDVNQTSSRGPTRDGRTKPEITAIGSDVYAPIANQNYANSSGTSMASPNVAGASVLLQEFYKKQHNTLPTSTLIKNVLINGSTHLLTEGPNFQYGYGLMNVYRSKEILENQQYFEDPIESNDEIVYIINVPSGSTSLKVLLNWMDPPGHPNADYALVHDLDLTVVGPDGTYLPWTLNPASDHVTDIAVRGIDSINNVEQVSILNPTPGSYQIKIASHSLIDSIQDFVVSYQIKDSYLQLQYPVDGLSLDIGKTMRIYWDHSEDLNGTTQLFYSSTLNPSWTPIATNINASTKHYDWNVPSILANHAIKIKVTHDNLEDANGNEGIFVTQRNTLTTPDETQQCWGTIRFSWSHIPLVDSYSVYLLIGDEMKIVDTVESQHQYKFKDLNPFQEYWYAVAPIINGREGIRSVAQSSFPQGTNCTGLGVNGDLTILKSDDLPFGRKYTSNILTSNDSIPFVVKNISPQNVNQFKIHYRINNGSWEEQLFQGSINSNETETFYLTGLDLENIGTYEFDLKIENLNQVDQVESNNSVSFTIKHLDNPVIDLTNPWIEDFENWEDLNLIENDYGIAAVDHWDFKAHESFGRVYIDSFSFWSIDGDKSLSLDNYNSILNSVALEDRNILTGTFNFSDIDLIGEEIRFKTKYILHSESEGENKLLLRGSDTDEWIEIYEFPNDEDSVSIVKETPLFNLNEILLNNNQDFSSSLQIAFIQQDSTKISSINFGTGLTIDNVEFFRIHNDLELVDMEIPGHHIHCNTDDIPIHIEIRNNVPNTVYNIPVHLFDQDIIITTEWIDSIEGNSSKDYTFDYILSPNENDYYKLQAVVAHPADTYAFNDSSKYYEIKILPIIEHYPYFENFDTDDGGYFASAKHSSWAHGVINAIALKNPYEGNKSWKTNLEGYSLNNENSYLYSPCFDVTSLNNPHLSFMANYSFKNYNAEEDEILDFALIEFSHNGEDWHEIPADHQYHLNYTENNLWELESMHWKPFTLKVPQNGNSVQFRWKVEVNSGVAKEGLSIDNVHLYDYEYPIGVFNPLSQEYSINANESFLGVENNELSFIINDENQTNLKIRSFINDEAITNDHLQSMYPQMWTVKPLNNNDAYTLGITLLDSLLTKDFEQCFSCRPNYSIYDYSTYIYSGSDNEINNKIDDNESEDKWHRNSIKDFTIQPYGKGYIVYVEETHKGELWLMNNKLVDRSTPSEESLEWTVYHHDENGALIKWNMSEAFEANISSVQVWGQQYDLDFHNRKQVNVNEEAYQYVDFPDIIDNKAYYKLRITTLDNQIFYTDVKVLEWDDNLFHWQLFPNPNKGPIINLYYATSTTSPITFQTISMDGKIIDERTIEIEQQTGHLRIPSDYLNNGKYFLRIIQDEKKTVMPFIKL